MNEKRQGVLNLDELFGTAKPVRVVWDGREYELLRPEGIDPHAYVRFERLRNRLTILQGILQNTEMQGSNDAETIQNEEKWANAITEVVDALLTIVCPAFMQVQPSFQVKTRALQFYFEQVMPTTEDPKKALPQNQTGA